MEKELTIREWINAYNNDKFDDVVDAGWYDWFCSEKALAGRLKKMASILKKIKNPFILDNFRVWFKNNCPCVGPLYDDMRFEPIDESKREEQYFLVSFNDKRENAKFVIYTAKDIWENGCSTNSIETNKSKDVVDFINNMKF